MKNIKFVKNDDNTVDVIAITEESWYKLGLLEYNEAQKNWVLWSGTSFSDQESEFSNTSDEGVSYFDDLSETMQEIKNEFLNY